MCFGQKCNYCGEVVPEPPQCPQGVLVARTLYTPTEPMSKQPLPVIVTPASVQMICKSSLEPQTFLPWLCLLAAFCKIKYVGLC